MSTLDSSMDDTLIVMKIESDDIVIDKYVEVDKDKYNDIIKTVTSIDVDTKIYENKMQNGAFADEPKNVVNWREERIGLGFKDSLWCKKFIVYYMMLFVILTCFTFVVSSQKTSLPYYRGALNGYEKTKHPYEDVNFDNEYATSMNAFIDGYDLNTTFVSPNTPKYTHKIRKARFAATIPERKYDLPHAPIEIACKIKYNNNSRYDIHIFKRKNVVGVAESESMAVMTQTTMGGLHFAGYDKSLRCQGKQTVDDLFFGDINSFKRRTNTCSVFPDRCVDSGITPDCKNDIRHTVSKLDFFLHKSIAPNSKRRGFFRPKSFSIQQFITTLKLRNGWPDQSVPKVISTPRYVVVVHWNYTNSSTNTGATTHNWVHAPLQDVILPRELNVPNKNVFYSNKQSAMQEITDFPRFPINSIKFSLNTPIFSKMNMNKCFNYNRMTSCQRNTVTAEDFSLRCRNGEKCVISPEIEKSAYWIQMMHSADETTKCVCPRGSVLMHNTCVDVNECVTGTHKCLGECVNAGSFYTCKSGSCVKGYTLTTKGCVDIDECQDLHTCDLTTTKCVNKVGSYECTCINPKHLLRDNKCTPPTTAFLMLNPHKIKCCDGNGVVAVKAEKQSVNGNEVYSGYSPIGCFTLESVGQKASFHKKMRYTPLKEDYTTSYEFDNLLAYATNAYMSLVQTKGRSVDLTVQFYFKTLNMTRNCINARRFVASKNTTSLKNSGTKFLQFYINTMKKNMYSSPDSATCQVLPVTDDSWFNMNIMDAPTATNVKTNAKLLKRTLICKQNFAMRASISSADSLKMARVFKEYPTNDCQPVQNERVITPIVVGSNVIVLVYVLKRD